MPTECVPVLAELRDLLVLGWLILCVGYGFALLLEVDEARSKERNQ